MPIGEFDIVQVLPNNRSCQSPELAISFMTNRPFVMQCILPYGKAIMSLFPQPKPLQERWGGISLWAYRFTGCRLVHTLFPPSLVLAKYGLMHMVTEYPPPLNNYFQNDDELSSWFKITLWGPNFHDMIILYSYTILSFSVWPSSVHYLWWPTLCHLWWARLYLPRGLCLHVGHLWLPQWHLR